MTALARVFQKLASFRAGRVPVGLFLLLPVALFIDLFDTFDELAGGIVGPIVSFFLESAFLLALTGRPGYAFGLAAFDIIPVLDIIPFATLTLIREIVRAWLAPVQAPAPEPTGPIIDI